MQENAARFNLTTAFREQADIRPDHPAVVDAGGTLLYRDLDGATTAFARRFRRAGVAQGDLVAILLPNVLEHLLTIGGVLRLGATIFALDPTWSEAEVAAQLIAHGVKWLVLGSKRQGPPPVVAIAVDRSWRDVTPEAASEGEFPEDGGMLAILGFSSGTTGKAKLIPQTHWQWYLRQLVNQRMIPETPDDRYGCGIPLSYQIGRHNSISTLRVGGTVVLLPDIKTGADVPGLLQQYRVTRLHITPFQIRRLFDLRPGDGVLLPTLRQLIVSSSAISADERAAARRCLTPHLYEQYGTNEAGVLAFSTPEDQDKHPDSVGRPAEGVDVEVVDDHDRPVPAGTIGILRTRTPMMTSGYYNDPEATRRSFRDGWFYPGDRAVKDAEGYIFLKGRIDDVIIFNGVKTSPEEVEAVLLTHPAIAEAAVVGRESNGADQVPVAFIVLRKTVAATELHAHCSARLQPYQCPQQYFVVPALPKNELGKVLRRELRARLSAPNGQNGP